MIVFTKNPGPRLFLAILAFFLLILMNAHAGIKSVPGMPGPISGQTNVCSFVGTGQAVTYSITAVADAAVYLWTMPPTATLVSGQGTTNISVVFASGFNAAANKQIRVRAISQD